MNAPLSKILNEYQIFMLIRILLSAHFRMDMCQFCATVHAWVAEVIRLWLMVEAPLNERFVSHGSGPCSLGVSEAGMTGHAGCGPIGAVFPQA
jgi:hypothetical protein